MWSSLGLGLSQGGEGDVSYLEWTSRSFPKVIILNVFKVLRQIKHLKSWK